MAKGVFARNRSRRFARRLARWAERLALGSLLLFLLGVGGMIWATGGARVLGGAFALAGLVGVVLHARSLWEAQAARLRLQRAAERRSRLQTARRERTEEERLRRTAEQEARARAAERLEQARLTQKQAAAQTAREQAAQRTDLHRRIEAEAVRLAALTDPELYAEISAIFVRRGGLLQAVNADYPGDFTLQTAEETALVRCLPAGRKGTGTDVEALEAWREQARIPRAYLLATAGFLPSAVTRLANLPLTLIEPHLLAHWKLTASDER